MRVGAAVYGRRMHPIDTAAPRRASGTGTPVQPSLDDLGTPLHEGPFVVVDLEPTRGTPAASAIPEIGAV